MLPVIRQSFIIVLAMLQLFAPLVHAHTGSNNFNQGLHIPGLELYRANQDASVGQNVNADWDSEGLLVVVDAGIKNPQDKFVESTDHSFALSPPDQLRISALPENDNTIPPQRQSFSFQRLPPIFSPRAPPAQ
jgi:hypothetical protein